MTKGQLTVLPKVFHVDIPTDLARAVMDCKDDVQAKEVGVEWMAMQMRGLYEAGVPSVHIYSLNATRSVEKSPPTGIMRFADIPGHEAVKSRLRQMADSGRIPHALLLEGPAGIGKMALARAFVQYVCCTDRQEATAADNAHRVCSIRVSTISTPIIPTRR